MPSENNNNNKGAKSKKSDRKMKTPSTDKKRHPTEGMDIDEYPEEDLESLEVIDVRTVVGLMRKTKLDITKAKKDYNKKIDTIRQDMTKHFDAEISKFKQDLKKEVDSDIQSALQEQKLLMDEMAKSIKHQKG